MIGDDNFVGQISLFAADFAPGGWLLCEGQTLLINDYIRLFAVIGDNYGGDGTTTFMLPDLRDALAIGMGNGFSIGQQVGQDC